MKLTPADLEALINAFEAGQWSELRLKTESWQLLLSTDTAARLSVDQRSPPIDPVRIENSGSSSCVPKPLAAPAIAPPSGVAAADIPDGWKAITAPNLGTFYRAPKPGSPPLVDIGQQVEPSTELCLIEVMKLFTTLLAGVRGIVRRICVNDAVMVEHGDVLFYIEPN